MAGLNVTLPKVSLERFSITARADYRFAPLNVLFLLALMLLGLIAHVIQYEFSVVAVVFTIAAALVLSGMFRLTQVWEGVVATGGVRSAMI